MFFLAFFLSSLYPVTHLHVCPAQGLRSPSGKPVATGYRIQVQGGGSRDEINVAESLFSHMEEPVVPLNAGADELQALASVPLSSVPLRELMALPLSPSTVAFI